MFARIALLLLLTAFPSWAGDAFYVWQQQWSAPVQAAVLSEDPTALYPLAAVFAASGSTPLVHIPWESLARSPHEWVPVFRIPLAAFKRNDTDQTLNQLTAELKQQMSPRKLTEIQLDLDCPERLLGQYADLLKKYRTANPDLAVSITVLPAHLKNRAFRELAELTDYYVLQVHGLEVPADNRSTAKLLNRTVADKAIQQAESLKWPYKIALPCYAYELHFDNQSGTFLGLSAEKSARFPQSTRWRIAADHQDLIELHQQSSQLKYAKGIIWFRLPVAGDRLCLPRAALAEIQAGRAPTNELSCTVQSINQQTVEMELTNHSLIRHASATVELQWPHSAGTCDLYQSTQSEISIPGQLPHQLSVQLPAPGETVKLGWFRPDHACQPTIEIHTP
jgi:hypothetical protein